MLNALLAFNKKHKLFFNKNKLILAISGGMDSMVLLDLASKFDNEIIIAHCNFKLRDTEADQDQEFVQSIAKIYDFQFETIDFDTNSFAKENKVSIQEAARTLRYNWFDTIRLKHKADWILTAHQMNDNTETLFYNLVKGTGIKGLRGMLPKNGKIVRPMLEISRTDIETYAKENNIAFREDSSNSSLKYSRNLIRNQVIPELSKINTNFEKTQKTHFERFRDIDLFYSEMVEKYKKELFENRKGDLYLSILKLQKTKGYKTLLFEMLNTYGFNISQVEDILESFSSTENKAFLSGNYRIIKDKKHLILSDLSLEVQNLFEINKNTTKLKLPKNELLQVHLKPKNKLTKMSDKNHFAYIDASKLEFPLVMRRFKDGDYFYPFGMYSENGKAKKKKIKKFFTDMKFSQVDKENLWILCSGEKIVWIVNHRIDDRYKITKETTEVFQLKFIECKN